MMRAAAQLPRLHLVTDDAVLAAAGFSDRAETAMRVGGREIAVHLRGPRTAGRRMFEIASALAHAAATTGATLVVNDRVDVALAAGAAGIQLGVRGMRTADARRLHPDAWVGRSVHDTAEAMHEDAAAADMLLAGNIFATASHPGREGAGPALVRALAGLGRPVIAIGGVTYERVSAVRVAGAYGVAMLAPVWHAPDVAVAVNRYLERLA
jgi:thiamine-phosphate diphosphorylase